ncbi:putative cellulase [Helianthus anomalus]
MGEEKKSGGCMGWFIVLIVVGAIALALGFTLRNKFHHDDDGDSPVPGPPGPVAQKFGDALKIAHQFFDIQKSGIGEGEREGDGGGWRRVMVGGG